MRIEFESGTGITIDTEHEIGIESGTGTGLKSGNGIGVGGLAVDVLKCMRSNALIVSSGGAGAGGRCARLPLPYYRRGGGGSHFRYRRTPIDANAVTL
ncbi:hypothetical protein EVAR_82359_1 [Eumeta japonica]|uniref:Uncharacterized protein n=1 Tax=Eumeta variegata TaxID=151549 RepID=A0A4C1UB93_EUMVA|nr:hypothetical protein EVAR_82359_1 [Eumeta japonica]